MSADHNPQLIWIAWAVAAMLCVQVSHAQAPALPPVPAQGMIAYKLHKQADEFAPCVEFSTIEDFPIVANMITMDRRFLSVQQAQVAYRVNYPSPSEELLTDEDLARLEKRIKEYEAVSKRFKYSAPLLAPWIAKFRHEVEMMQQGFGRVNGSWMQRASYAYDRDRERLRAKFEARKAEILHCRATDPSPDNAPLWASAMEAQRLAEQAAFRKAFKEKIAAKQAARAEDFHKTTDSKLTRKSPSRLSRAKLDTDRSLDTNTELDTGDGLNR